MKMDNYDSLKLMVKNDVIGGSSAPRILCSIPTRGRYESLLRCLQSIAFQTVKPTHVTIYDDSDPREDIRIHPSGRHIMALLARKSIEWDVIFTPGQGQHIAHQMANSAGYDLVWRMDDDAIAEPDVLERLLAKMSPDVGAVGGAVYEPGWTVGGGNSDFKSIFENSNFQWCPDQGTREVDHLYSSFLYRPGIVNYKFDMSPVAFHEESIFTYRLKRAGYKLIADTSIHTYHLKCPSGGCRDQDNRWAYAWDQVEFIKLMENEWKIKLISIGSGLGDCLALKNIIPDLKKKYELIIIGSCYEEVFNDIPLVASISYSATKPVRDDHVYKWMSEQNWKGTLVGAFGAMFT